MAKTAITLEQMGNSSIQQQIRQHLSVGALDYRLTSAPGTASDIDWELLLDSAKRLCAAPLLYMSLRDSDQVPPPVIDELRAIYGLSSMRSKHLLRDLDIALFKLEEQAIPVILLKGAALACLLYPDPALRPMGDLDIVVQPEHAADAIKTLESVGYTAAVRDIRPGSTFDYESQVMLIKAGEPFSTILEVHWSLLDSPHHQANMSMAWFWETSTKAKISGRDTLVLGLEATLLHLCAHFMLHHQGSGLLWEHDIALFLRSHGAQLDWRTIVAKAQAFDLVLPLRDSLTLVCGRWPVTLQPSVLAMLAEMQPSSLETLLYARLTAEHRPVAQRFWTDLAFMPGSKARATFLLRNLFPSPDYMRNRYQLSSPWLLPACYAYRLLRGASGLFQ